jgi:hypothetical protein
MNNHYEVLIREEKNAGKDLIQYHIQGSALFNSIDLACQFQTMLIQKGRDAFIRQRTGPCNLTELYEDYIPRVNSNVKK